MSQCSSVLYCQSRSLALKVLKAEFLQSEMGLMYSTLSFQLNGWSKLEFIDSHSIYALNSKKRAAYQRSGWLNEWPVLKIWFFSVGKYGLHMVWKMYSLTYAWVYMKRKDRMFFSLAFFKKSKPKAHFKKKEKKRKSW